jgi:hypothetical protein
MVQFDVMDRDDRNAAYLSNHLTTAPFQRLSTHTDIATTLPRLSTHTDIATTLPRLSTHTDIATRSNAS